jgi:hypothetical protein
MRKGTPDIKTIEFIKKKRLLRQYYKQLKAHMITEEQIPEEYRILLMRYYGL